MTQRQAELLLMTIIAARSTSYAFSKLSLTALAPWNLLSIRFALASLCLYLLFRRRIQHRNRQVLKSSLILGSVLFACMSLEAVSLQTIDSSMASFLESTAVLLVLCIEPFILKQHPPRSTFVAAACIICGIFLLTTNGTPHAFSSGAVICLAASFCYAAWILLTSRYVRQSDPILIGILQMGVISLLSTAASIPFETYILPNQLSTWLDILALVFLCSVFGFTFQPLAQKYTSADKAGLFAALNPLIAACIGWICLDETLTITQGIGGALILTSIVWVQRKTITP